ncbi:MAG: hypothetical protein M1833_007401 [Piccolia ochrophora]|nr:MAG: hypothetical protein M1833_007401 [Piccolia ochrophora]
MTAQILNAELANIIQETKRKNTELRIAAEQSLEELKNLPATSEQQLAADLSRRPQFVTPFLIACAARNAKCIGSAVIGLQRLIISGGLAKERLKEVLDALHEATTQNVDVQLKILQALPPLLQNYASSLQGDLLGSALHVCSTLQTSKSGAVNNTAAATLQQLVVSVFDKVVVEDETPSEIDPVGEAPTAEGNVAVGSAALDAYRVFNDICLLTDSQKPRFLRMQTLPQKFGMELIESLLANHANVFLEHTEQAHVLRLQVMPFVIKSLQERLNFSTTVRVMRILYMILRHHLEVLVSECGSALALLITQLDPNASPPWKRALCMEIFRGIYGEPGLIRKIYSLFDIQEGNKNIIREHMAILVRLATEKPGVIGVGSQSTIPVGQTADRSSEQATMEAGGVGGMIGGVVNTNEVNISGISVQWSSIRVPCLDQLDKSEPPNLPESYIYSLTLMCINNFSEGLAKFILPLTVPSDRRGKRKNKTRLAADQDVLSTPTSEVPPLIASDGEDGDKKRSSKETRVPVNPMTLDQNPLYSEIKVCASLVDTCWPAVLAACSTFLYAALDNEYYHGLVRSFQKFTHVAGLLRQSTPRDAFLTTLAKAAIPANILSATLATPTTPAAETQSMFANAKSILSVDSGVNQSPAAMTDPNRQNFKETISGSLNTRNLLCLRALLNLAIALGPTLGKAWSIPLEALQQADFLIHPSSQRSVRQTSYSANKAEGHPGERAPKTSTFGSEVYAVETAASRMFDSTSDFPDASFIDILKALFGLLGMEQGSAIAEDEAVKSPTSAGLSLTAPQQPHRRVSSMSGILPAAASQMHENHFALGELGSLASINIRRLVGGEPDATGWNILVENLTSLCISKHVTNASRLKASEVLNDVIVEGATHTMSETEDNRAVIQRRLLTVLHIVIQSLVGSTAERLGSIQSTDLEVQRLTLEALRSILEQSGEAIVAGWETVFSVMTSVFNSDVTAERDNVRESKAGSKPLRGSRSVRLVRSSFASLQLICSDFLSSLTNHCIMILIDTLSDFSFQDDDLNISLTTINFFWNVSDFLRGREDSFSLDDVVFGVQSEAALVDLAESEGERASIATLWMFLLLRLAAVTIDPRAEVRNGAIQTVLRIFDSYGDQLRPDSWRSCLEIIVFKIMEQNQARQVDLDAPHGLDNVDDASQWHETTILVVNGIAGLFSNYLDVLAQQPSFPTAWQKLMSYFEFLIERKIVEVNAATFTSLCGILKRIDKSRRMPNSCIELVWRLWSKDVPEDSTKLVDKTVDNQDAYIAYVETFNQIYRLIERDITEEQVTNALKCLSNCVVQSHGSAYSTDTDRMTTLQSKVLETTTLIRTDISKVPSAVMRHLAGFISLPFASPGPEPKGRLTFVALSRASMQKLQNLVTKHLKDAHIYSSTTFRIALEALALPISQKYSFRPRVKGISLWSTSTTRSIAILSAVLPALEELSIDQEEYLQIWRCVVTIACGMISADVQDADPATNIASDQDFDIDSFSTLRDLITPSLGSSIIPDKHRRSYAQSLFTNSLIHQPAPYELPTTSGKEILEDLYEVRMGRTYDPPPSPRSKMSYVCLDELFSLVARHDGSPERVRLAQAVSPFLILRCAVTIRAYIADQPLRGLMPQPRSQRRELLHILHHLVALECEPRAIPAAPGVVSDTRKHLHRLFPLVSRAVRVAWRDQEVLDALGRVMDMVGGEMGVL